MNPTQLAKLPLIFHLVEVTKIETDKDNSVNLKHSIKSDFYQTPNFLPEVFYKAISKIC